MAEAKENKEATEAGAEGAEGAEAAAGGKKPKKKLIIIIAAVVGLLVLGGVGAFVGGVFKKGEEAKEGVEEGKEGEGAEGGEAGKEGEAAKPDDPKTKKLYMNIGEFLVNLNAVGKQPSFLKMTATLEVVGEDNKLAVEQNLPRIKDTFQVYLRELRAEDLKGSAGVYRLREALLLRLNKVLHPAQVSDILFEELIVQ